MKRQLQTMLILSVVNCATSQTDTTVVDPTPTAPANKTYSNYFQSIIGGLNAIYQQDQTKGAFDMAVQTCHYFIVTGKRIKNDSIHALAINQQAKLTELYKGVHFFVLNRASVQFDSIQSMAVNYLTSLKPSPLTLRVQKEFFLTRRKEMSPVNFAPIVSIKLIGDGRAVPFLEQRSMKTKLGASGHMYLTFQTRFKRIEYAPVGHKVDQGVVYFSPSIGIAYGSNQLMKGVLRSATNLPIVSTECRLGFQSDKHAVKDFSFLVNYTMSDIIGPRMQMGILLTAIQ